MFCTRHVHYTTRSTRFTPTQANMQVMKCFFHHLLVSAVRPLRTTITFMVIHAGVPILTCKSRPDPKPSTLLMAPPWKAGTITSGGSQDGVSLNVHLLSCHGWLNKCNRLLSGYIVVLNATTYWLHSSGEHQDVSSQVSSL